MSGSATRAWGLATFVVLAQLTVPLLATADEAPTRQARERYEKGQRLYKVSRYRDALEEFKEAFVIKEDPVLLYNIAQCHRMLGESEEALRFYRRYLVALPRSSRRPEVERRIGEMEARLAEVARSTSAPSQAVAVASTTPARSAGTEAAAPPTHHAPAGSPPSTASAPGILQVRSAGSPSPGIVLATAAPSPAAEPAPSIASRWWFWTGLAVLAASAAVGSVIYFGRESRSCGAGLDYCAPLTF